MSDTLRAAAQQALEALENAEDQLAKPYSTDASNAIAALRAALAAAVAEPVASVTECEACFTPDVCQLRGTCDHYAAERLRVAAPPQREPKAGLLDQFLALAEANGIKSIHDLPGLIPALQATEPPQREPLTDEQLWSSDEIMSLNADLGWHMDTIRMFARAIERAHGIAPASAPKEAP